MARKTIATLKTFWQSALSSPRQASTGSLCFSPWGQSWRFFCLRLCLRHCLCHCLCRWLCLCLHLCMTLSPHLEPLLLPRLLPLDRVKTTTSHRSRPRDRLHRALLTTFAQRPVSKFPCSLDSGLKLTWEEDVLQTVCNSPRSDRWVRRATLFSARSRFLFLTCRSEAAASCLKGKRKIENLKKTASCRDPRPACRACWGRSRNSPRTPW